MGFLELENINTLELFLTDKGKELMLRENGQGLFDLINQFSLDDRDYDYRRASSVWATGQSPSPPGPGGAYPNQYGSTTGLINDQGITGNINPCAGVLDTNECWWDLPDVRGDRGNQIIHCVFGTASTITVRACTNVYAFYDVTSIQKSDADAAKLGLNEWFDSMSAATPNYSGKLFHIPVYGERWLNTTYYPWNGKLDTWNWNGAGNSGIGPQFLGNSTITTQGGDVLDTPVTGLYLQTDNTGIGTGSWSGFAELPPDHLGDATNIGQGGRAEFWTLGCTLNLSDKGFPTVGITTSAGTSFTATTTATGIEIDWDPSFFDTNPYLSGTTIEDYMPLFNDLPYPYYSMSSGLTVYAEGDYINLCESNCCPDASYAPTDMESGSGLFGCQECSPFDSTVTDGKRYDAATFGYGSFTFLGPTITAGTATINLIERDVPCNTYRGMDRNVLIVNIFDETEAQDRSGTFGPGGICPLGEKTYYNGFNGDPANVTWNQPLGDLNGTSSAGWTTRQYMGYHGAPLGGTGSPPLGVLDDWNQNMINWPNRNIQPTEDYKYSHDLFMKTTSFYDDFRGFVYPVVYNNNNSRMEFPLHLYGAMEPSTVPISDFVDNPTVVSQGGTLSAITFSNPYTAITPIFYSTTVSAINPFPYLPNSIPQQASFQPLSSHKLDPSFDGIGQMGPNKIRGLKNFGWGFKADVGCLTPPCSSASIFTGGTFATDLGSFVTGSTGTDTVSTGCTICQCLPAVFLNRQGPLEIIDDPVDGCPCPDGSIDPSCCETTPPPPDIEVLCGPLSFGESSFVGKQAIVDSDGVSTKSARVHASHEVPGPTSTFTSGRLKITAGAKILQPPQNMSVASHHYSSDYSVGFGINLHQFTTPTGKISFDIEMFSTSRYGNHLIGERDALFYYLIESGYQSSQLPLKHTRPCIALTKQRIKENINKNRGGSTSYLRAHIDIDGENAGIYKSTNDVNKEVYEFCIGFGISIHHKLYLRQKRVRVSGDPDYGYILRILTE